MEGFRTRSPATNPVAPAELLPDEVIENWANVVTFFPYVTSIRTKTHTVSVGYPAPQRDWRTIRGWPFGISEVAKPVLSLPTCHKSMCERCLKAEREEARMCARASVLGVGEDAR